MDRASAGVTGASCEPAVSADQTNRPIRVCFIIDQLRPAGTEKQLLGMIDGFDRRRLRPYLCLLNGEDSISRSLEPRDCPILRLGMCKLLHLSSIRQAWRLVRFIQLHRIDVMQAHFPDSTYFGVPAARLAGVPRVVRARRDLGYWMRPLDRRLGRLYNHLVDATLVNSQSVREAVLRDLRPRPETVVVMENGVDLKRFKSIPPQRSVRTLGGSRAVGLLANLRAVKDPELFVRAAAIVAGSHPDVSFALAGEGELRPRLERLVGELGMTGCVQFLGSLNNVPEFLRRLEIAVLCSRSEGLSNALLEYMAAGRAIVATAVGGNVELIEDGVHGLLVPPGDPVRLAAAIDRLLINDALAQSLGEAARRRVEQRFSLEVKGRELEDFYRGLLGRGEVGGCS
jgi:L-malate glycosyltransferase